ncbi:MAG: hypothetical protein HND44_21285 [Chloroflexi bacterium]|nr:hypothetical protein [Ardenticatenaceae bacterium]MBL1130976.1 hypothetical protein [Chloroflexota bacterium]NOG37075.1 hypothetical protein [Chloroflexota bacterium]GIK57054.1 MAG: hypothetical protein BroJett015_27170 [Chloroflexota bacterium]
MLSEPVFVTLLVIDVLEKLDIPYLIGGSFASTAYGRVRTTQDVDLVAEMQMNQVEPFVKALNSAFYADEQMIQNAIQRRTSFNLIHLETLFKVDIFIPKARPFDREQLKRRVQHVIDQETARQAYFASAEDTILAKLEWYRLGGEVSEQQWRDIQGILQLRGDQLDLHHLQTWATALRMNDLLERALKEAAGKT